MKMNPSHPINMWDVFFAIFLTLKLTDVKPDWSWWFVFAPLIVSVVCQTVAQSDWWNNL